MSVLTVAGDCANKGIETWPQTIALLGVLALGAVVMIGLFRLLAHIWDSL